MSVLIPTEEQIAKLQSLPADEPVGALNLFHIYKWLTKRSKSAHNSTWAEPSLCSAR